MRNKLLLFSLLFLFSFFRSQATHVVGGVLEYERLGTGSLPNSSRYKIKLKLWRDAMGNPWFPINPLIEVRGDTLGYTQAGFDPYGQIIAGGSTYPYRGIDRMNNRDRQFVRDFTIACGSAQDTMLIRSGAIGSSRPNNNTFLRLTTGVPGYENPTYVRSGYPAAQYMQNGFGFTRGVCDATGAALPANAKPVTIAACQGGRICVPSEIVDSCTIVPPLAAVIQFAEYIRVVDLPNIPGGYHLKFELCCRNNAILNLNNPGSAGFSVYARIPDIAQLDQTETAYNHVMTITSNVATTVTSSILLGFSSTGPNLTANSTTTGTNTYTSVMAPFLSTYTVTSQNLSSISGVVATSILTNRILLTTIRGANTTVTSRIITTSVLGVTTTGVSKSSLGVAATNSITGIGVSISGANVITGAGISGNIADRVRNSSPSFVSTPPLFVCQYSSLAEQMGINQNLPYDHSAIDKDGDEIEYALSFPNDGDESAQDEMFTGNWQLASTVINGTTFNTGDPLFATQLSGFPYPQNSNLATFNRVTFRSAFSDQRPLGLAVFTINGTSIVSVPGLSINSTTGIMDIKPAVPEGLYVVNVRAREFRRNTDGSRTFLGEISRDYQFRVLFCPLPAISAPAPSTRAYGFAVDLPTTSIIPNSVTPAATISGQFYYDFGRDRYVNSYDAATGLQNRLRSDNSVMTNTPLGINLRVNTTPNTNYQPTFNFSVAGTYYVKLVVQDRGSPCADSAYQAINVSQVRSGWQQVPRGTVCVATPVTFDPYQPSTSTGFVTTTGATLWTSNLTNPIPRLSVTGYTFNATKEVYPATGTYTGPAITTNNTPRLELNNYSGFIDYMWMQPVTLTGQIRRSRIPPPPAEPSKIVYMRWNFGDGNGQELTLSGTNWIPLNGLSPRVTIVGANTLPNTNGGINLSLVGVSYSYLLPSTGTGYSVSLTVMNQFENQNTFSRSVTVIQQRPSANGVGGNVCVNNPTVTLTGAIGIATGGVWSGGSGGTAFSFSPASSGTLPFTQPGSNLTLAYRLSAAERIPGTVLGLNLTTYGNGVCPAGVSTVVAVNVFGQPNVIAGSPASVCGNNLIYTVNGSVTGTGTAGPFQAYWVTRGTGSFTGIGATTTGFNGTSTTFQYRLSKADSIAGSVKLMLISTVNGICNVVRDSLIITVLPPSRNPTVNAGSNASICANNARTQLSGTVTNSPLGGIWSTLGSGTFTPLNTSTTSTLSGANAYYTPSPADTASANIRLVLSTNIPVTNGGCNNVRDTIILSVSPSPKIFLSQSSYVLCANNPVSNHVATIIGATGVIWDGRGAAFGSGTYNPSAVSPNWTSIGGGRFLTSLNYTATTAEATTVGLKFFDITTTGNGLCNGVTRAQTMQYLPASTVSIAGPAAVTVCKNNPSFSFSIRLTGILTYIRGNWRTSGTGSFTPNTSFTGSSGATQTFTYVPSSADTALGTVRLIVSVDATDGSNYNCNTVTDTLDITYTNLPAISAGPDQRICENNLVALLSGSVTNPATGGIWSTNGTGSFGSAGSGQSTSIVLGASYFPSATDLSNGSVQLTLTTTGPGIGTNPGQCAPLTRSMNVTFSARPTIQFGTVPITCENNPTAQITATIVGQTAGQNISLLTKGTWSGGTGTYSPNNSNFNTVNAGALGLVSVGTLTYTPSASELASRAVNLILSATGVGTCAPFTSNFSYTISPKPSSDITTPNPTICANNPVVSIESQITGATNGVWTGGANPVNIISSTGGNFSSQYTPSSAEINSGNAKLYFTTSGESNNCLSERDSMLITISKAPTASTGGDMVVCGALTNVTITGTITGATGGIWNTSGSGTFMNIGGGASTSAGTVAGGNMTIIYTPSALDRASVTPVKLKLTNYGVGNCLAVFDQMNLSFSPIGVADAGVGQTVCNNDFPIQLNATGNSGSWSVSPNPGGSFANANNLSTTYSPATTIAGGTLLTFTWATTGFAAACNVSDTVNIRILPAPIVSVVSPNTVCGSNGYFSVSINGSGFGNAGTWSTSGSGTFSTSGANLSTSYIDYYRPSAADITAGSVTLSFTGTGTSPCSAVRTSKTIRIDPPITAEAGATQTLCDDITSINLNGQIFVNGVSTTSGVGFTWTRVSTVTGSYPVPDPTSNSSSLNVLFTPSAADKNSGGVKLILTPNSLGTCTSPRPDTVTYLFQKAPTASIFGGNFAVCSDTAFAELTGTFTGAAGLIWTTTGTGSFSPDQFATTIRYIPSANDKLFGTVRFGLLTNGSGLCPVKGSASQAVVTIVGKPILSAGPDLTICGNNTAISLTGANMTTTGAYVPSTIVWSTSNSVAPIGTFTNGNTIPNNGVGTLLVYNASSKERLSDQIVTLRVSISGVGAGACPPQSDTRVFTFTPPPIVSAGADMTLCGDASSDAFTLTGTATVANAGRWSPVQGTGSIVGIGNNGLRARYIPSLTDKSRLTTTLGFLLTTTLTGCLDVVDQMNVTLTSVPGVTILGGNQTLCGDALVTNVLNAQSSSGFGIWSTTATGMFSPNSTTLVGVRFAPLQSEIINAYTLSRPIKITLSSDLNGVCAARTTDMFVTITPPPAITAGSDTTVCTDVGSVPLYGGSLTVSSGIVWSTSSSQGRFSNNATTITGTTTTGVSTLVRNVVMESYTPGTAERNAGSVVITARSTGSGQCAEVFAVKNITFIPEPTVSVNPDQTVCANNSLVNCVANVTNAVRVRWFQVGGNGNFLNDAATSTQYFPGKQDSITAALGGVVSITCSVVGNSLCQAKTATFKLRVTQSPVVKTAGTINICADTAGVILSGTSLPALTTVGVQWSNFTNPSSSASNFSANRFLLTPTFLPTAADKASGTVKLLISTTGNGACNAAYDTLRVVIQKVPQIQVPADMNVCTDFGNVINLTFSGQDFTANSLGYWSSTGDGNYGDPSPLNPVQVNQAIAYYVTQNDKNRGRVTLIVNAYDGAGLCKVQTGRINVTFTGLPTVSAGVDGAQCYNSSGNTFSLTGIVSGTEKYGYRWKHAMDYGANLSYITSSNTLIGSTLTVTGGQASDLGILNTSADGVSFIMDAFGIGNSVCKNIQSDTIFIGLPSRFVLSILGLNSICSDISSINIGVKDLGAENQQPSPSGSHPSTTTGFGIQWNARNSSGVDALASQYALNKFQPSITYTLSASDRASGSITFNYTTSGNGVCPAQIDSKTVTINQAPILGTLSGITACSNNSLVTLTASGSNFTNVYWTSSSAVPGTFTGNFTPTVSGLNTAYQPSAEEINIGIANLVLRAQRAGCTDVTRSLAVDIKQAPVVSAGLAGAVCSLTGITVTGTIDPTLSTTTTAGTGWSIVSGSATLVATQYSTSSTTGIMTATNIVTPTGGTSVTLRLTANEPFCNAESSDVTYTFEQTPAIVPGTPFERCASDIIQMQPASTSAQGFWTTSGLGRFASSNSTTTSNMSDVYKPTTAEIENGAVIQFTLIGLPTSCGTPAGVSLTHTLTSGIIAKASEKRIVSVCEDVVPTFTATLTGSSMGTWQAFGSGTFTGTNTTPGNNFTGSTKSVSGVGIPIGGNRFVFTESYRGSAADLAAGRVVIRLSAIPDGINSNCSNNASDTLSIFYTPRPRAFSGGDRSACGNIAVLTTPGGGLSISGTAFLPSPNSIDPFATPINSARLRVVSGSGVFRSTGTQTSNLVSFGGTNLNVTIGIDDVFIASPLDTVPTNPQVRIVVEAIYVGTIVGGATCADVIDTIKVGLARAPYAFITTTTNGLCNDLTEIKIFGDIKQVPTGVWSTTGTGRISPDSTWNDALSPAVYTLSNAERNITAPQNIFFILQSDPTGSGCLAEVSSVLTVTIYPRPIISVTGAQIVCADLTQITLSGVNTTLGSNPTAYTWISNGSGTISGLGAMPSANFPGIYSLNNNDIAFGSLQFTLSTSGPNTCKSLTKLVDVSIAPRPTISLSLRQELCRDSDTLKVAATINNASGVSWTVRRCLNGVCTAAGTGSFVSGSNNSLTGIYLPSTADLATVNSDSLEFTAITTGSNTNNAIPSCNDVSASTYVKMTPLTSATINSILGICADLTSVNLSGLVSVAGGGKWSSSGGGTFFNDFTLPTVSYQLSAEERNIIFPTTVGITLTTESNGTCKPFSANFTLSITGSPKLETGADKNVCADTKSIPLTDAVATLTGGGFAWNTLGTGSFTGTNLTGTNLTGTGISTAPGSFTYIPSAADSANGAVILVMTSTGPNPCNPVESYMTIRFDRTPNVTVSAGLDQVVCADNPLINLNGVVINGQNPSWRAFKDATVVGNDFSQGTGRGSFSPDSVTLNASYFPSVQDTSGATSLFTNQVVRIRLRAYGTGSCSSQLYESSMRVTFTPLPRINVAVSPSSICANDMSAVSLTGQFLNNIAAGGSWTSSGTGNGNQPNSGVSFASVVNPPISTPIEYLPSTADKTNNGGSGGRVGFTFTTQAQGTCRAVSKSLSLVINPAPSIAAGFDQAICETQTIIGLSASTSRIASGFWRSSGTGSFTTTGINIGLSVNTTNGPAIVDHYRPSAADIASGKINLFVKSTSQQNNCPADSSKISLSFDLKPIVNAGLDQTICAEPGVMSFTGALTNVTEAIWSVQNPGSGSFSPNASNLSLSYKMSENDKVLNNLVFSLTSNSTTSKCPAVTSTPVTVTINKLPTATVDYSYLCTSPGIALVASTSNSLFGTWTSTGVSGTRGTFSPTSAPVPFVGTGVSYIPSSDDIANGSVSIALIANGLGTCASTKTTITPSLKPNPNPPADGGSDAIICRSQSYNLNVRGFDPNKNFTYQWLAPTVPGNTLTTIAGQNQLSVTVITNTVDSLYVLKVVDNVNKCSTLDTVKIITKVPVQIPLSPQVCYKDNLLLSDQLVTLTGGRFQWYRDGQILPQNSDPNRLKAVIPAKYTLEYTEFGCVSDTITNVRPLPFLLTKGKVVCKDTPFEISPTVITVTSYPSANYTYKWYHDYNRTVNGFVYTLENTNTVTGIYAQKVLAINGIQADTANYLVSVMDSLGCQNYDTVRVKTHPKPLMALQDNPACEGDVVTLDARPDNRQITKYFAYPPTVRRDTVNAGYAWLTDPAGLVVAPRDTMGKIIVTTAGTYFVKYQIGECFARDTSKVQFNVLPKVNNAPEVLHCPDGGKGITLDAGEGLDYRYLWLASGKTSRYETVYDTSKYYFKVFNKYGCNVLDSVNVKASCEPKVFTPGAFVPDGDDPRDRIFTIFGKHFSKMKITIYNRWGEVIFVSEDVNFGWDGTYQGSKMPMGVYPYIITYEGKFDEYKKPVTERKSVTLIR